MTVDCETVGIERKHQQRKQGELVTLEWAVHRFAANSSPSSCPARADRASCKLLLAFSVASMFLSLVLRHEKKKTAVRVQVRVWRAGGITRAAHSIPRSTSGIPISILALRVTLPSSSSLSFLPFSASSMSANLYFSATLYSSSRGSNGLLVVASPLASSLGPRFLASSASM